jgi:hypothetical protein
MGQMLKSHRGGGITKNNDTPAGQMSCIVVMIPNLITVTRAASRIERPTYPPLTWGFVTTAGNPLSADVLDAVPAAPSQFLLINRTLLISNVA